MNGLNVHPITSKRVGSIECEQENGTRLTAADALRALDATTCGVGISARDDRAGEGSNDDYGIEAGWEQPFSAVVGACHRRTGNCHLHLERAGRELSDGNRNDLLALNRAALQ